MSEGARAVHRKAAAKINLYLHVTGKRADGYHLLDSLIVFLDAGDHVEVAPAEDLTLDLSGPFGPELGRTTGDGDNLVMRAAGLLREHCRVDGAGKVPGARMELVKNLPLAAGVGGGSADAAAVLGALCELWDLHLSPEDLAAVGLKLGADVPACLAGTSVLVSGIGEKISPTPPLPDFHLVLVNPGIALSTARVFGELGSGGSGGSGGFATAQPLDQPASDLDGLMEQVRGRRNDLQAPAIKLVPEIAHVLEALEQTPGCRFARMSGSGATCFGIFGDAGAAVTAAENIRRARAGWWVLPGAVI